MTQNPTPLNPTPAGPRPVRAARGSILTAKSWQTEGPLRMLMNNLDPEVAEHPDELVVYGGTGKAARNWECYDAIVRTLETLDSDETLLVQSGKPVGVFRPTSGPRACSSPTPTSSVTGRPGRSSADSSSSASRCTVR